MNVASDWSGEIHVPFSNMLIVNELNFSSENTIPFMK